MRIWCIKIGIALVLHVVCKLKLHHTKEAQDSHIIYEQQVDRNSMVVERQNVNMPRSFPRSKVHAYCFDL
jgi:hypothetical protein